MASRRVGALSTKANPAVIGSFVLGAVALLFILVLGIGGGGLFRETQHVAFFDGTVQGLEVGSRVTFQGVPIGSVAGVRLVVDAEDPARRLAAVTLELERSTLDLLAAPGDAGAPSAKVTSLIERGLRARLVADRPVTGPARIELGFHPETPARLRAPAGSRTVEIPSIPPDLRWERPREPAVTPEQEPFGKLVLRLESVVESLDRLVEAETKIAADCERLRGCAETRQAAAALEQALARLDATLDRADSLFQRVGARIDPLMEDLDATLAEVDVTMAGARDLLADLRQTTSPDSELYFNTNATLQELERSMRALRAFLDFLDRHPELLLRGKARP